MNQELRNIKTTLRNYLKRYPADRLAALLAHAQEGKLSFLSCCCFIGVETADHALEGKHPGFVAVRPHLHRAREIPGAREAEAAYCTLGAIGPGAAGDWTNDGYRRKIIIPMVRAEFRRRDREVVQATTVAEVAHEPVF